METGRIAGERPWKGQTFFSLGAKNSSAPVVTLAPMPNKRVRCKPVPVHGDNISWSWEPERRADHSALQRPVFSPYCASSPATLPVSIDLKPCIAGRSALVRFKYAWWQGGFAVRQGAPLLDSYYQKGSKMYNCRVQCSGFVWYSLNSQLLTNQPVNNAWLLTWGRWCAKLDVSNAWLLAWCG